MGFKLVRVDAIEPCKVPLSLGSHFIGRGKFLDCHDHRVSRKHAELIVTTDSVLLKSLHQNPCFYKEKYSNETNIFSQPDSQVLTNGDQFGLLPDTFWFEIIYFPDASMADMPEKAGDEQDVCLERDFKHDTISDDSNTLPFHQENQEKSDDSTDSNAGKEAQSLLPPNSPSIANVAGNVLMMPNADNPVNIDQPAESPGQPDVEPQDQYDELIGQLDESVDQQAEPSNQVDESPSKAAYKRTHSQESSPCDVKKVKMEPEESQAKENEESNPPQSVKTEPDSPQVPQPGPSNDQAGSSTNGTNNAPPMPQSPTKPPNPLLRERCMYGANCYRRNPQHKARFSHPNDSDWGTGERAPCPWGVACRRADPRHWRDHDHPPGVQPPQPGNRQGMQVVRRNGNNFFINANAVHFYDDRFEVEDSDGDSVDYDYEF